MTKRKAVIIILLVAISASIIFVPSCVGILIACDRGCVVRPDWQCDEDFIKRTDELYSIRTEAMKETLLSFGISADLIKTGDIEDYRHSEGNGMYQYRVLRIDYEVADVLYQLNTSFSKYNPDEIYIETTIIANAEILDTITVDLARLHNVFEQEIAKVYLKFSGIFLHNIKNSTIENVLKSTFSTFIETVKEESAEKPNDDISMTSSFCINEINFNITTGKIDYENSCLITTMRFSTYAKAEGKETTSDDKAE